MSEPPPPRIPTQQEVAIIAVLADVGIDSVSKYFQGGQVCKLNADKIQEAWNDLQSAQQKQPQKTSRSI